MTAHYFDSTEEAYGMCQCDDSIHDGDVLVIAQEGVVGLAGTWPVSITATAGGLHKFADGQSLTNGKRAYLPSQILEAVEIATGLGFPLASYAQGYAA